MRNVTPATISRTMVDEQTGTGSAAGGALTAERSGGLPLPGTSGRPLRRDGLLARIALFAALAVLAEASLALPPRACVPDAIASVLVLALIAALVVMLPWDRLPPWCEVAIPLLYVGSVYPLIVAAGGQYTGITLILLSPVIWTALYHHRWNRPA